LGYLRDRYQPSAWNAREVIGVDIDDTLVRAAWRRRRSVWSMQRPFSNKNNGEEQSEEENSQPKSQQPSVSSNVLYPTAFELMFGSLPIPPSKSCGSSSTTKHFPHNITFRTTDWVNNGAPEDGGGYDVIVAFSVSKWIHINNGDDGLVSFFRRVFSTLIPGGLFVLEPQKWETYSKARRMDARLKEAYKSLSIRPCDFTNILVKDVGFMSPTRCGSTQKGGIAREIVIYRKPCNDMIE